MRKKFLICYDISDDKIRTKVARELLKYCFRTQKSVFEGKLTEREVKKLFNTLKMLINYNTDVVYFFPISQKEEKKILRYGVNSDIYKYIHIFI